MDDTPLLERRKARASDALFVHTWFPTRQDVVTWAGSAVPDPLTVEWLAAEFQAAPHWVWVDDNDTPQAIFTLLFREKTRAHLARFCISPAMRGKGLARGLIDEIADEAYEAGADHLTLTVYTANARARHVYEQAEFRVYEEIADDPAGPSVRMRLPLTDA